MAWNPNRFIPIQWMQAVQQANEQGRWSYPQTPNFTWNGYRYGTGNQYLQAVSYGTGTPYSPQAPVTGAYRLPANSVRSQPRKKDRKHSGFSPAPKQAKRDHGYCNERRNQRLDGTSQGSRYNGERPASSQARRNGMTASSSRRSHVESPTRHHHSWGRRHEKIHPIDRKRTSSFSRHPGEQKQEISDASTSGTSSGQTDNEHFDWDESRFQLERRWEDIDPPGNLDERSNSITKHIRVISYNILSQKLLDLNSYLYKKCNPDILPWDYRWPKLKYEIKRFDADILCLQEVEECHYKDDILPFLESLKYHCHYKRRTGNNANKPDGVLIAYKPHHFRLCDCMRVEYRRGHDSPINQDNVALITLLKPVFQDNGKVNDRCLCIVNTHLLYNPKRGDIKLAQLSTLFSEIHHMLSKHSLRKIPMIMCGDFNSIPDSHLFNFITTQELDYRGLLSRLISGQKEGSRGKDIFLANPLLPECIRISEDGCVKQLPDNYSQESLSSTQSSTDKLSHSLGPLFSAHNHHKREASTTQDKGVTVDYVFHTPYQNSDLTIYPKQRLSLICPEDLLSVRGIPNAFHPSDHLPIVVDFALVNHN